MKAAVPDLATLQAAARAAGLAVTASACWPETDADIEPTPLAGFVDSVFPPLFAAVAGRAVQRSPFGWSDGAAHRTAIVMVTAFGDATSAAHVAAAVAAGRRVNPLMFFQSVPNAVAGHVAERHGLTGPVVCLSGLAAGAQSAALLIADGDAEEALVVWLEVAAALGEERDRAAAVVVTGHDDAAVDQGRSADGAGR